MVKLFKYTKGEIDLFYSIDMKEECNYNSEMDLELATSDVLDIFIRDQDPKQNELINLYAEKNNLERIAVLDAHGTSINGKWYYSNGKEDHSVQRWIGQKDGKYKLLILNICNPEQDEISSKKSIILAPNESHDFRKDFEKGDVQAELFFPGKGYVSSYEIESEIEKLKE